MAEIFSSFSGHWSPVADARRLKAGKILDIMFDGVPIVFFRDEKQKLRALINRCPHRSVKLSLGKLHKDGTIQCSFHGFRFDGSGACRHIPLNPEANPAVVRAQALLCEEKEGLLWIYSGDSEKASVPPLRLPAPLNEGEWYGSIVESEWPVHWSRSVQTALDVAHIPFTHPKSIGVAFGRALGQEPNARLQFKAQHESDGGFHMDWWIDSADGADASQAAKDGGWVAFHPPNGMSLGIPQKNPSHRSLLFIWGVPIDGTHSRTVVLSRRNYGQFNPIPLLYDLLTPIILSEDRRNLETAWPSEVPELGREVSMPADAPSIAFQRYYKRLRARSERMDE